MQEVQQMTSALQFAPRSVRDAGRITADTAEDRPQWVSSQLFPFTSRFADIDGAHLHYVDEGAGPALLMVPGSPMWSFMYRRPIQELRGQFRCIAVDRQGWACRGRR
jgi:hypothetical protein